MNHRTTHVNAVDLTLTRVRRIDAADVRMQAGIMKAAIDGLLRAGRDAYQHWLSLADTANMAETLEAMNLGSGPDARRVIEEAQESLAELHQARQERGTWALAADERQLVADRLQMLRALHVVQLQACSYGEFQQALNRTAERVRQARAGNAPRGAIVVEGQLQ